MVVTLATVDGDGSPRARSVICRRLDDLGRFWIVSDARSDKNRQLRQTSSVELVYWSAATREQVRLRGEAEILSSGDANEEMWRQQSDATRALFLWPEPGAPRDPDPAAFPNAIPASEPPPASFEVIVVPPQVVEHLDLNPHPHRRRRWRREAAWAAEELNP